jgi:hypothetical protein
MDNTLIHRTDGSTVFTGDAVELYRLTAIRSGLRCLIDTDGRMQLNRSYTSTNLLRNASAVTHKQYKRGKPGWIAAEADLTKTINTLKAAIPVTDERTNKE